MSFIIGQILSPESLETEYKEFRLEMSSESPTMTKTIFHDTTILKSMFLNVIEKSMRKYIAKYACAFFNTGIDGKILFGVSDNSEVVGLPIMASELDSTLSMIDFVIKEELDPIDPNLKEKIIVKSYKIDTIDQTYVTYQGHKDYIRIKYEEHQKHLDLYEKYIGLKKIFMECIERYRRPIKVIINDPEIRLEFIEYLKFHDKYHLFRSELESGSDIPISDIKVLKHDDTTIVYWITNFRDIRSEEIIKTMRPLWTFESRPVDPYYCILQDFKPMIDSLVEKNFYMYIIEINFKFKNLLPLFPCYTSDQRCPIRSISSIGDPCCTWV
jgi:hypothetical protein